VYLLALEAMPNCSVHTYGSFTVDKLKDFENKGFKKIFGVSRGMLQTDRVLHNEKFYNFFSSFSIYGNLHYTPCSVGAE
jgi:hypothetical protein